MHSSDTSAFPHAEQFAIDKTPSSSEMNSFGVLILALAGLLAVSAENNGYKGYKVMQVYANTDENMKYLMEMNDIIDAYGLADEIDFWVEPAMSLLKYKSHALLMVSPAKYFSVVQAFEEKKISYEVTIEDMAKNIEEESRMSPEDQRAAAIGEMTWTAYHRYPVIEKYINKLATDYPHLVKLSVIGQSYEGRNLYLLHIGVPRADGQAKQAIWMDSHIHAREWITSPTTTWMVNHLVTQYGINQTCTDMLDKLDFFLLPVVNPDGVEHSAVSPSTRMWRATRRVSPFCDQVGTDANRNYDYMWMVTGASQRPCLGGHQTYAGPYPFSEIENDILMQAASAHKNQIKVFLTVHSAAQMILVPWAYGKTKPTDYKDLYDLARRGADALTRVYGTRYQVDIPAVLLGASGGTSYDWGKAKLGAKYSYTIELRDGGYGFLLPANQIIPSGIETFEFLHMCYLQVVKEFGLIA